MRTNQVPGDAVGRGLAIRPTPQDDAVLIRPTPQRNGFAIQALFARHKLCVFRSSGLAIHPLSRR
jgi:hypothetical protein